MRRSAFNWAADGFGAGELRAKQSFLGSPTNALVFCGPSANTYATYGSIPDSGATLGHSRSTFSSGITRPKPSQCGCATQAACEIS
jgi:hypothetical protein